MRKPLLLLLVASCAFGLSSLKVLPGVREAGMGNVGVAAGFGPQAMVWNPAATARVSGFAARVSYVDWLLDSHQQALYLVRNFRLLNVGLGVNNFNAGNFEHRREVPTEEPLGLFAPNDFSFHLNLSRTFGRIVDLGLSGRFYYSKIMEDDATGTGLDAGVRVRPLDGLTVGASVVDFARNLVYYRESFRMPLRARAGAAWETCLWERVTLGVSADGAMFIFTREFNVQAGAELGWAETVFLRAGYERLPDRARIGGGLGLALGQFRFDYSLTPLSDDLGLAHRVSVGLGS